MKNNPISPASLIVLSSIMVYVGTAITGTAKEYCLSYDNLQSAPYTLITYLYCSSSLIHLAVNSVALLLLMDSFRNNHAAFIFIFFTCGIISGLFSVNLDHSLITAGSSGAIYGLAGAVTVLDLTEPMKDRNEKYFYLIFWIINVYINYAVIRYSSIQIDWVSHLIGWICGMAITFIFVYMKRILFIYQVSRQYKKDMQELNQYENEANNL